MPLHRQRIVPKKISRSSGLVNLNHNRIPSVFVSLVAIALVAGGTVWLINNNTSFRPTPQVAAVREKMDGSIDVDPNNAKAEEKMNNQPKDELVTPTNTDQVELPEVNPVEPVDPVQTEPEVVRISPSTKQDENVSIKELNCSFTFSKSSPEGVKTVAQSDQFWIPNTDCKNEKINLLQIISSKSKPQFEGIEIQSLDSDTEYALLYWKDSSYRSGVEINDYLVPLTKFLSNGKLYFSVKDSFDKLLLNNKDTYYLSGNCNGEGTGACVLWGLPANGSLVSLLTDKGVANTATGQENNLKKGQYLKFAKVQDRNNRIALVLKKSETSINLIYIDPGKNYGVDEVRTYDKDTAGYTKYFR